MFAHPYAAETAEFGTMRAETGIAQLFHANEASEDFRNTLKRDAREEAIQTNLRGTVVCQLLNNI